MKTLALLLIAVSSLLSGCYVYPEQYHDRGGEQRGDRGRDGGSERSNRNHDGDRGDRSDRGDRGDYR